MAEDKNGFLLYKDLIKTVQKLPKDKAGELFMHILKYVNDEEPETDDLLIEVAFEPVKQKLKRDLKKYEETKEKNRENANKRWQKEKPTESSGTKKNATASDRIPEHAKHADSDSDTGNDTDSGNDTDFLLEKETKSDLQSEEVPKELFEDDKSPDSGERKKVPPKKESDEVEINYRFDSKIFIAQWNLYKVFRKKKHRFTFLDNDSENRKLTELFNLSNGDEKFAIKIIQNSIDSGYKGLFLPKNLDNGKSTHNNSNNGFTKTTAASSNATSGKTSATTAIARHLAKLSSGNSQSGDFTADAEIL
ncbi:DUF6291 domain-containing protein [Chryseobacterium indoltheticum]|uniref:DUF6291 domain-containing protein n=1 Tax=Chryseobacterium indoltheticum TaxID=254 RepID=A0A381FHE8_9FLAO|nr:DUF6291 domain-containing protein [Chryseobacterium indoltheticum]AZA74759.1 hypothetical protein EG358_13735 [Chryseobacterium indoltheticum]SIQ36341.1 hypothetical protein SAMN05421682_104223 [Chryseobacterium indoltheticum]SUX45970.1 Uncharacterised protein [Chryseobacterium indoltheticum]